jgi:mono/diheme cytochrome c family protein
MSDHHTTFARATLATLLCVATLAACAARSPRRDRVGDAGGHSLYLEHCVGCHGPFGAGDGPMAHRLPVAPPDLREISGRHAGRYPFDEVRRVIDGRHPVEGHGGAGMPAWGDAFLDPSDGYRAASVKEKVAQLARYLASIQVEGQE